MKDQNNPGYVSTLTVVASNNPQYKAQYLIGPFETPEQLQYHCKFLLNFIYKSYPASTSLVKMIQEINEQEQSEDTGEYDISQNILYLIPWRSLANEQPIKRSLLQKPHTNIIAKITNNNELVFFMRQNIDQHNILETGLECPEDSKIYVMHGFAEALRIAGSPITATNLVIASPEFNMKYIGELLCPKNSPSLTNTATNEVYKVPIQTKTQVTETIDSDREWGNALEQISRPSSMALRASSPLVFSTMREHNVTTPTLHRTTSAYRQ